MIPGLVCMCVFVVSSHALLHCVAIREWKQNGEPPKRRERERHVYGKGHGRRDDDGEMMNSRSSGLHSPADIELTAYTRVAVILHTGVALCPMR